jgi:hypothetical protein
MMTQASDYNKPIVVACNHSVVCKLVTIVVDGLGGEYESSQSAKVVHLCPSVLVLHLVFLGGRVKATELHMEYGFALIHVGAVVCVTVAIRDDIILSSWSIRPTCSHDVFRSRCPALRSLQQLFCVVFREMRAQAQNLISRKR